MASALLIISVICFIGGALLFLTLYVSNHSEKTYDEDRGLVPSPSKESWVIAQVPLLKHTVQRHLRPLFNETCMSIKKLYRKCLQAIQKRREDHRRERDACIQESSQRTDRDSLSDVSQEIDTSFLENQTFSVNLDNEQEYHSQENEISQDEQESQKQTSKKADYFVENILSEDEENRYIESVQEPEVDTISDNYYYQYMEKRYIKKIMNNPKDTDSYIRLGDLYMDMHNYEDACESYKTALKLDPHNQDLNQKWKKVKQRKDIMDKAQNSYS